MSKRILFLLILLNLEEYKTMLLRGKRAREGQFPWLIQFQTVAPCGGVLLSPDWVLTAAQCVQDKRNSIVLFAAGLNGTESKQMVHVKATYIFPRYEAYSTHHDRDHNIALLKLIQPFDKCDTKVMLPDIAPVRLDDNYKSCLIFGWQSYVSPTNKVLAKPIQYSEVILNSWKLCTYMIKGNASYEHVFCTMVEFQDEMKACAGNPGSPVVCKNQYHKIVLLGIASWTNFSLDCGNLPTYLDVSVFRVWIHDLVFDNTKAEEWNTNGKLNKALCTSEDPIDVQNDSENYTDVLQTNSQIHNLSEDTKANLQNMPRIAVVHQNFQKNSTKSTNTSYLWHKLHPSTFNSDDYTKASSSHVHSDTPYVHTVKEQGDGIQQYREIGQIKSSRNRENELLASSNNHGKLNHPSESPLYKNMLDKFLMERKEDQIDNIDDFEFIFPFNFEDAIASYSNAIAPSKNLVFFYIAFLYLFYTIVSNNSNALVCISNA